jgi:hypothetical protein
MCCNLFDRAYGNEKNLPKPLTQQIKVLREHQEQAVTIHDNKLKAKSKEETQSVAGSDKGKS